MNEAVSMLYHLADKYRRSRKNHSNITIKDMNKLVRSAFHDVGGKCPHQFFSMYLSVD